MFKIWERARKKSAEESKRAGFGWAMAAYYLERHTLEYIEGLASNKSMFDCGAKEALIIIHNSER